VTAEETGTSRSEVEVRLQVPPPENLALKAKAKASSFWGKGYEADKVNDGDTATRWNAGKAEKQGCWIELDWDKPVTFDRVVIDEVMEFGGRIEAWKLEAGDDKMGELARGTTMGLRRTIELKKPVEAKRLRLTIEKAVETPTIREIEVYRIRKER
jgi:alpha-L-fucosidase